MAVAPEADNHDPEAPQQPDLKEQLSNTLASSRRLAADLLGLFGLEARLAGLSAGKILAFALVAAFTVITAWLCLQGALIVWLHQVGLNLGLAFLLFTFVNVVATGALAWLAVRDSRNLTFPATRRALKNEAVETDEQAEAGYRSQRAADITG